MSTNTTSPQITISPASALIDENVQIFLSGFPPNIRVTLHAHTQDDAGKEWVSQATFVTDENGTLDVGTQRPITGTYSDADAMGLFWSMRLTQPLVKKQSPRFSKTKLTIPTTVSITAAIDEKNVVTTQAERLHIAQGVTETTVQEDGLVGKFYQLTGQSQHPGILVLSGSDGLIRDRGAALLASHGYAALALVYFGSEGLPSMLANIPLEYFEKGIQWLQYQPNVASDKIGVIGTSRGGELALLLGATFPQIKAVIANAPSGIVHSAVSTNAKLAGWTYQGKPIPFSIGIPNFSDVMNYLSSMITHKPISTRETFLRELTNEKRVESATIPVEKIQGPILLVSGEDDRMWASTVYADMIGNRLATHNFPYPYQHLHYKGAGHLMGIPYGFPNLPPPIAPLPAGPVVMMFGGNTKDSAFANADSWQHTLTLLKESFGSQETTPVS